MKQNILLFVLVFLSSIVRTETMNAVKLNAPKCEYTQNSAIPYIKDLSIVMPDNYTGDVKNLTIHYMVYDRWYEIGTGQYVHECEKKAVTGMAVVTEEINVVGGLQPEFFGAYASASGYQDSDIVYFSEDGYNLEPQAPIIKIDNNIISASGYTVTAGAKVQIENPNIYKCKTGSASPFRTKFCKPSLYSGLPNEVSPDANGNVSFTAYENTNLRLTLAGEGVAYAADKSATRNLDLTATPIAKLRVPAIWFKNMPGAPNNGYMCGRPTNYEGHYNDLEFHYVIYDPYAMEVAAMGGSTISRIDLLKDENGNNRELPFGVYASAKGYEDSDIVYWTPQKKITLSPSFFYQDGNERIWFKDGQVVNEGQVIGFRMNTTFLKNGFDTGKFPLKFVNAEIELTPVKVSYSGGGDGSTGDNYFNFPSITKPGASWGYTCTVTKIEGAPDIFNTDSYTMTPYIMGGDLDAPVVNVKYMRGGKDNGYHITIPANYGGSADQLTYHYVIYNSAKMRVEKAGTVDGTTAYVPFESYEYQGNKIEETAFPIGVYASAPGCNDSDVVYAKAEGRYSHILAKFTDIDGNVLEDYSVVAPGTVLKYNTGIVFDKNGFDTGKIPLSFGESSLHLAPSALEAAVRDNATTSSDGTVTFTMPKFAENGASWGYSLERPNDLPDVFSCSGDPTLYSLGGKLEAPVCSYAPDKDDNIKKVLKINSPNKIFQEVTVHYMSYNSEIALSSPYLPTNSCSLLTQNGWYDWDQSGDYNIVYKEYYDYGGIAPKFFGAYLSAEGYEDSEVVYFCESGNELKTESPRVFAGDRLVDYSGAPHGIINVAAGTEIRIENPNVYEGSSEKTAPFITCFGTPFYKGLPSGVTPDENGNVTFTTDEPGASIDLELSLMVIGVAANVFNGWDTTVCNIQVQDTATGVDNIGSDENESEEIYTLEGIRVTGKVLQKGVYIVVRNGNAEKRIISGN